MDLSLLLVEKSYINLWENYGKFTGWERWMLRKNMHGKQLHHHAIHTEDQCRGARALCSSGENKKEKIPLCTYSYINPYKLQLNPLTSAVKKFCAILSSSLTSKWHLDWLLSMTSVPSSYHKVIIAQKTHLIMQFSPRQK